MDAIKYLEERMRYEKAESIIHREFEDADPKRMVDTIEKWSKEHPIRTRADVFRELFPKCSEIFCPQRIEGNGYVCNGKTCLECMNEYWGEEAPADFGKGGSYEK